VRNERNKEIILAIFERTDMSLVLKKDPENKMNAKSHESRTLSKSRDTAGRKPLTDGEENGSLDYYIIFIFIHS